MAFYPAQLVVEYSAANVRLFFRVYFILLGIIVAPLGQACSAAAVKLKLSKGKDVRLTEMLGWLGGVDTLLSLWKLRTFPSGPLLTFFMLAAFFTGLASDLVGSYIRTVEVHDQCTFGTGLVLSSTSDLAHVPWNGYPYTVIQQATSFSLANQGLQGIYAKVNQDTRFSASENDILGSWKCTQNVTELDYPTSDSILDIATDLVGHGLLYSIDTATAVYSGGNTSVEHIVILDTSNDGIYGETWNVKASISTYNVVSNTNTMLSFQCTLEDTVGWLTNILKVIDTDLTIPDWRQVIQGSCYSGTGTPARSDLGTILANKFNAMVMIASANNYLLNSSESSSTQGCLTDRTWVLWEVVGLAMIAAMINLLLLLYIIVLKLLGRSYKKREQYSRATEAQVAVKAELEYVPGDFLGWTSQAVEESSLGTRTRMQTDKCTMPKDLKRRKFGWRDSDNRFGVLQNGEHIEEVSLLVQRPK